MGNIDFVGIIFALGIVFWLAGGASWLKEKTRELKLKNDRHYFSIMKDLKNKDQ